jgi:outer membrane receptor protein involved in Fe transport
LKSGLPDMKSKTTPRNAALSIRLGLTAAILAGPAFAQTQAPARDPSVLDEIVVTATKRSEAVREISGSVSAYDETRLERIGAQSMEGYLTRTPGVVFNQTVPGNSTAILRGVATTTGIAQAQGTTGYFLNDVPLTDPFYSGGIPDVDTFDVDNVAVLRGPQGTLFGSASLGGAINYQASKPNAAAREVHLRGTLSDTRHGAGGYSGQAMVNLPLVSDVLAIRGVFTQRRDSGYIDNLGTGQTDANRSDLSGGRILAAWTPFEGTSVNYLFLDQIQKTRDVGAAEPGLGDYAKSTQIAEPFKYRTTIHNLRIDQDLGFATLTATATHHAKTFSGLQDYSGLAPAFAPVAFAEPGTSKGDTFEVRLASPGGNRFDYIVGFFYDATDESVVNQLIAPSAAPLLGTATLIDATVGIRGRETALFGEGTYRFSDSLRATLGGRFFRTELNTLTAQGGPLSGGSSLTDGRSKETGLSPKVSVTWEPSSDLLVYGLASKGFRFGGPNIALDPTFPIPREFQSDSLINYELGARTSWLDRRLQLDGTLYWVNWDDIQITQHSPGGFTYTDNAGKARNRGFEGTATFQATPALVLQGGVTYLDAKLRSDFGVGAAQVAAGARLPGASRWQISDSVAYTWAEVAARPSVVFSHRYISSAPGELTPSPPKQGGYNLFDLRLSANLGPVGVTGFVENIGDERGVSRAAVSVHGPVEYLVRPRTIGVTLDYRL